MSAGGKRPTVSKGDIVNHTWILLEKVGSGTFSEIYFGCKVTDPRQTVAVKIQNADVDSSVLHWEADVLRALSHDSTIPQYYHHDNHHKRYEYIVMEFMGGEDMSVLRDRIRHQQGYIPLPIVLYFTLQISHAIRKMHEKGYVHRDIKPANFVRKSHSSTQFCMVDFGIAKLHIDKQGKMRPQRKSVEFRGTSSYASPAAHQKEDLSLKDDIISLAFVFLNLLCGSLPWTAAARVKDKAEVAVIKLQYMQNPEQFRDWAKATLESKPGVIEGAFRKGQSLDRTMSKYVNMMKYLRNLQYADIPDYDLIDAYFKYMITDTALIDAVGDIYYKGFGFNWNRSPPTCLRSLDMLKDTGNQPLRAKILYAKGKLLGKDISKVIRRHDQKMAKHAEGSSNRGDVESSKQRDGSQSHVSDDEQPEKRSRSCSENVKTPSSAVKCSQSTQSIGSAHCSSNGDDLEDMDIDTPVVDKARAISESSIASIATSIVDDKESNPVVPDELVFDSSLAFRWHALVSELMTLDQRFVTREHVELYENMLVMQKRFYATNFMKSDIPESLVSGSSVQPGNATAKGDASAACPSESIEKATNSLEKQDLIAPGLVDKRAWEAFMGLQKTAYEFSEKFRVAVLKRPRDIVSF